MLKWFQTQGRNKGGTYEATYKGTPSVCLTFSKIIEAKKICALADKTAKEEKDRLKIEREKFRTERCVLKEKEKFPRLEKRTKQALLHGENRREKEVQKYDKEVCASLKKTMKARNCSQNNENVAVDGLITLSEQCKNDQNKHVG